MNEDIYAELRISLCSCPRRYDPQMTICQECNRPFTELACPDKGMRLGEKRVEWVQQWIFDTWYGEPAEGHRPWRSDLVTEKEKVLEMGGRPREPTDAVLGEGSAGYSEKEKRGLLAKLGIREGRSKSMARSDGKGGKERGEKNDSSNEDFGWG